MPDAKISALPAATTLDGTEQMVVVQGGVSKRATREQVSPGYDTVKCVTTQQSTTGTALTAITALTTALGAGTYLVKVWLCFRSAATTTGIELTLAHTGTTSRCVATQYSLTTATGTANATHDQASAATGQQIEGKAQRVSAAAPGTWAGVDTANADQFMVLEGIVIVTATGNLEVRFRSEISGSAITIMEGTTLTLSKVA